MGKEYLGTTRYGMKLQLRMCEPELKEIGSEEKTQEITVQESDKQQKDETNNKKTKQIFFFRLGL